MNRPFIGISVFGRGGSAKPSKTSSGLIYKTDFEDFSSWVNDGTFTKATIDALMVFDPLPNSYAPIGDQITCGTREPCILKEGSKFYLFYDSSDNTNGFVTYWAETSDGGRTWTRNGIFGPGYTKGTGGTWFGICLGWVCKIGNLYYNYRVTSDTPFNAPYAKMLNVPYFGEIWTSPSLYSPANEWTYINTIPDFAGTWANQGSLPGSIIKVGSTYYHFFQGYNDGNWNAKVGFATSATPHGPWTLNVTPVLSDVILNDTRMPENPKVFYYPVLNKYICLNNLIGVHPHLTTDQHSLQISSVIDDWSSAKLQRVQEVCPMDTTNIVGVSSPVMQDDNTVLTGQNNFVPFFYDADGTFQTPAFHYGRKLKIGMFEPSKNSLRFDGSASGKIYIPQVNTNFVIEFGVEFPTYTAGETLGLIYRADGTGGNEYILKAQNGGGKLILRKRVAGSESTVATGTGNMLTTLQMINRIRVVVNGTSHKAYINGELQIDATDNAIASGTTIGCIGENVVNGDIRLISMRSSALVTFTGLTEGQEVILRADGGICASVMQANSSGNAVFNLNHYPFESFDVNGRNFIQPTGIWGGDIFDCSKNKGSVSSATLLSATIENADRKSIVLTFSEVLDESIIPTIAAFVMGGNTVASFTVSGAVVTVVGTTNYYYYDVATISYTVPQDVFLRTLSGNKILSFANHAVTNNLSLTHSINDSFTDTNAVRLQAHTMNYGAGWTESWGTWTIQSNKPFAADAAALSFITSVFDSKNYEITLNVSMPNASNYAVGLTFRFQDTTHFFEMALERDAGGTPYVKLVENTTQRATANVTQETATRVMRVTVIDDVITGYWNDIQLWQYTSTSYNTIKKVGILKYNQAAYDDVAVDDFLCVAK